MAIGAKTYSQVKNQAQLGLAFFILSLLMGVVVLVVVDLRAYAVAVSGISAIVAAFLGVPAYVELHIRHKRVRMVEKRTQ